MLAYSLLYMSYGKQNSVTRAQVLQRQTVTPVFARKPCSGGAFALFRGNNLRHSVGVVNT